MKLNADAVAAFWQNRLQNMSAYDDAGLSIALADDELSRDDFETLKQAYLQDNPQGDFEAFLADALDGFLDQQASAELKSKLQEMGRQGSAISAIHFQLNGTQDGYEMAGIQAVKPAAIKPAASTPTPKPAPAPSLKTEPLLNTASHAQVQAAIHQALSNSFVRVPERLGENRHALNRRLQAQTSGELTTQPTRQAHYDGSDVVVIAFEGTGAFEPRIAPVMQEAVDILREQGLALGDRSLHYMVSQALKNQTGKEPHWSGLAAGPLQRLLKEPELESNTQWLSFPSEEFELLSDPDAYKKTSLEKIVAEGILSSKGVTPGIESALLALQEIQRQARAQGKNPKIVVVSHSSGGRSAVKFLEKAKGLKDAEGQRQHFPLVLTIDPVREAHEAVLEAGRELLNKGTEHNANRVLGVLDFLTPGIKIPQKKVYPPTVRYRPQPESLYKPSNTGTFLSFFQRKDTEGLKMSPKFGIHGSPVAGAENIEIHDVGRSGHGQIAYHDMVTQAFVEKIGSLLFPDHESR